MENLSCVYYGLLRMCDSESALETSTLTHSDDHKIDGFTNIQSKISTQLEPQLQSKMFKLNLDCFDEIFEYLSMEDLYSFGQTCKAMQKMTSEYFKRNHSEIKILIGHYGIYVNFLKQRGTLDQLLDFFQFGRSIICYIRPHKFDLINHIKFSSIFIDAENVDEIKNILPNIRAIQLINCSIQGNLDDVMLKFCKNLKHLSIKQEILFYCPEPYQKLLSKPSFLHQNYSKLEHLEMYPIPTVNDLKQFFQINPSVQHFSTDSMSIWRFKDALMTSDIQLDQLEIRKFNYCEGFTQDMLCDLFNQLHGKGFYQRLHLHIHKINDRLSAQLKSIRGFETLYILHFSNGHSLSMLTNLKELEIFFNINDTDMDLVAKSLVNLQRLFINHATIDEILPFICHSRKLNTIRVLPKDEAHFNGGILKLVTLNKMREKLLTARKMVIYVPDDVFLNTKWSINNGNTNFSLIEMMRWDSCNWNHHFC